MTKPRIRIPLRPLARILQARSAGEDTELVEAQILSLRRAQMQDRGRRTAEWRLVMLAGLFVACYAVIGARMGMLAATPVQAEQRVRAEQVYGDRADILDRNGRVLATNLATNVVYAELRYMQDGLRAAEQLGQIFPELDVAALGQRLTSSDRGLVWIRQRLSPEQAQAVYEIGEPGLTLGPREMRLYPNGALAAHVLGGSGYGMLSVSGAEIIGQFGLEHRLNERLSDPDLADVPVTLTLDLGVQAVVEDVLGNGMGMFNARAASAVVMEARTGEIVAMASLPDFDPNDPPGALNVGDPTMHPLFNRNIQGRFELGSVMKAFTTAQLLELGLATPETILDVPRTIRIGRHEVRDFHYDGPRQSVSDILVHSSNIGTIQMARMIGPDLQRDFLRDLGLLAPLTVEVAEASNSRPLFDQAWTAASSQSISYGHGLAITPVHVAGAFATLVNGGFAVTPTLIQHPVAQQGRRVISETTSWQMRRMMRLVAVEGTARNADVPGYVVGGKTGTANKPDTENGGYHEDRVIATFVGAFPMNDPQYVIVVSLDEPSIFAAGEMRRTAGWTAAPVTSEIIRRIAPMLGVRPQSAQAVEAALNTR